MKLLTMKYRYDPEYAETNFSYGKLGEVENFVKLETDVDGLVWERIK